MRRISRKILTSSSTIALAAVGAFALSAFFGVAVPNTAAAQATTCELAIGGPGDGGATAANSQDFACGPGADATGVGTEGATAIGNNPTANGGGATAVGNDVSATGNGAVALGGDDPEDGPTIANGEDATAVGAAATALGTDTTAVGNDANASDLGATAAGADADASGELSTATGFAATASEGRSTATGANADASGLRATATGSQATASGELSTATGTRAEAVNGRSVAIGADAIADPTVNGDPAFDLVRATAIGSEAEARNRRATAVGSLAIAGGGRSTAVGDDSVARGFQSTAIGSNARTGAQGAPVDFATAVGSNTRARETGSVALGTDSAGNGAVATRENQFVLGTANHTYTAPGITSDASRSFQTGPLEVVTTDANGNLASDGGQIFEQISENGAGVAIAIAMENPDLVGNETFGLAANVGFFEGNTALAVSAMGVLGHNFMGGGERWAVSGGVGVSLSEENFGGRSSDRTVGGRAGLQVSW
jgi:hypothetical protein